MDKTQLLFVLVNQSYYRSGREFMDFLKRHLKENENCFFFLCLLQLAIGPTLLGNLIFNSACVEIYSYQIPQSVSILMLPLVTQLVAYLNRI